MEFIPHGDLGKLITEQGPLEESAVKMMASQMIGALGYLHQNNITHRDVKPDNILVSSFNPWCFKLTDFGLSKMVDNEETFLRTFCGTLLYCAPEVYSEYGQYDDHGRRRPRHRGPRPVARQRYDHAVDIWSLGGVLFYALTQSAPFPVQPRTSYAELLHQIMTTDLNTLPLVRAGVSPECIEFLSLMLQRRPENRATVEQLQEHPWLGGKGLSQRPGFEESLDEISDDDELQLNASQLSLDEGGRQRHVDDEDIEQIDFALTRDDMMGDEDSEKENQESRQIANHAGPRLFGEVNVSAIGSSGVIPEERLNLDLSAANSLQETVILGSDSESQIPESFESDHFTPNRKSQPKGGARLSNPSHHQSLDQLQSLVHNVASQSLGSSGSPIAGGVSLRSNSDSRVLGLSEFNTSKRKPALDTSDELEAGHGKKPVFKRLKSANDVESLPDDTPPEELKLLASIPSIQRLGSGRQIDNPVHKTIFWDRRDARTYHLAYPEMTQLQLDVFRRAARDKGQEFIPGDSDLWKLALKHFPPCKWKESDSWNAVVEEEQGEEEAESLPNTLPPESQQPIMVADGLGQNRLAGLLESPDDSIVKGIHLPVNDSILSWGRGLDNTHVFERRNESMIPKYAFKILLWKEGYDAARDRGPLPWQRICTDEDDFLFYISTKATNGIWINNYLLQSHDSKKPSSPSHHWIRLYNGDEIVVWGVCGSDRQGKAKVTFRCFWGGSRASRDPNVVPEPVHVGVARRLDEIYLKAERKAKNEAHYMEAMDAHCKEHALRERFIDRERARSDVFEMKRRAAKQMLATRNVSGRGSPSSVRSSGSGVGLT
jgi:serine/threonine protein kinase